MEKIFLKKLKYKIELEDLEHMKKRVIAAVISLIVIVSIVSVSVLYHYEKEINAFQLNSSYFDMKPSSGADNKMISYFMNNVTEKTVKYSFGQYTLAMTPDLYAGVIEPVSINHFGSINLTKEKDPIEFLQPYVALFMTSARNGSPNSLGFLPLEGGVISPNGTVYAYNLHQHADVSSTLSEFNLTIGPSFLFPFTGTPTNYSMPLMVGQYTLELSIALYHLLPIGFTYLGKLTFKEPFVTLTE